MKPLALCPNPMVLEEPCKSSSFSFGLFPPLMTLVLFYSMKVTSKRRRTKQEILEEQAAALAKAEAVEKKLKLIDELQEQQIKLQAEQEAGKKA